MASSPGRPSAAAASPQTIRRRPGGPIAAGRRSFRGSLARRAAVLQLVQASRRAGPGSCPGRYPAPCCAVLMKNRRACCRFCVSRRAGRPEDPSGTLAAAASPGGDYTAARAHPISCGLKILPEIPAHGVAVLQLVQASRPAGPGSCPGRSSAAVASLPAIRGRPGRTRSAAG